MAKESLTPMQSGLKGINTQKEVVEMGHFSKSPWGRLRASKGNCSLQACSYQGPHFQIHSFNLNAVKDYWL